MADINAMKFWAMLLLAVFIGSCFAGTDPLKERIDSLLKAVEKSDAKFVRNGDEHSGKEAAEHMRRKYDHFKKEIKTTDDFIAKCASKSETSGKPYMIKTADGTTMKSEDWMKARLAELDKKSTGQ